MPELIDLDFSIEEDALIQGLLDAKGKRVEVLAFGIIYAGTLDSVDIDNGTVVVSDSEDKAMIEIERIESISIMVSS
ncbi:MAG TPA: hypothetical protein PLZ86_02780 [bacterium]|nr:hypothetical protein [bacterium]